VICTPEQIAAEARSWVGTPWHHQASLRGIGADCIGLVVGVAAACGVKEAAIYRSDPLSRGYGREPVPEMLLGLADKFLDRIAIESARLGDVLLFNVRQVPMHFGIISREAPRYIVHSYITVDKVAENRLDVVWARRVTRAYRFRGID
jgi:NlpC/P60 family putative phage cell wall peptidase